MINIEEYTIEELLNIRDKINNHIRNYDDGYLYICEVRSYGKNWTEKHIKNVYALQELCDEYDGEHGIVDVYSTNPNLKVIQNYGNVKFIHSERDYVLWKEFQYLKVNIPQFEKDIEIWETRDKLPFNQRPYFGPIYNREDIEKLKVDMRNLLDEHFISPVNYE